MWPAHVSVFPPHFLSHLIFPSLVQKLIPHLDRHLALPLLNHLTELDTPIFPLEQLQKAQYELAKGTNMIDYAEQLAGVVGETGQGESILNIVFDE